MTGRLLNTFKQKIKGLTLVPAGGGCFELSIDGKLVYSKLQTGQFPDEKWVIDTIGNRLR